MHYGGESTAFPFPFPSPEATVLPSFDPFGLSEVEPPAFSDWTDTFAEAGGGAAVAAIR